MDAIAAQVLDSGVLQRFHDEDVSIVPRPAKLNSDLVAEVKDLSSFMDGYDVVSFDLFDTLLTRSFARPADVFEFVGRVRRIPSFAQDRVRAEILARQRKRVQDGSDEVTYADIQHELRHFLPRNANDLEHEELSAEFRLLNVNALGMASYQAAVAKGKRIIVVSDMYLPSRFLHNVLLKNGFSPERVFVSGELGVSKGRDGGAFRAIASKLGIEPSRILHIGDNARADFYEALQAGWGGYLLVSPHERLFRDHRLNQAAIHSLMNARGSLLGPFLVSYLATRAQVEGKFDAPRLYGRMYAAPYLFAFVNWLDGVRQSDGVKRLLLMTRDGHALQPLFALIGSTAQVTILHGSRRMAYLATLADNFESACEDLANSARGTSSREFLDGLEIESPTALETALTRWIDLDKKIEDDRDVELLCRALRQSRTELLAVATNERAALKAYLDEMRVTAADTAIVDCGWRLSIQRRFEQVVGGPIRGYYVGTSDEAQMHSKVRSFLFNGYERSDWHSLHMEGVEPSVPTPMRHRPPGSLPLRATGKTSKWSCPARQP